MVAVKIRLRAVQALLVLGSLTVVAVGCGGANDLVDRANPTIPRHTDTPRPIREPEDPEASHVIPGPLQPVAGATSPVRLLADSGTQSRRDPVTIVSDAIQPQMVISDGGIYVVFIYKGNIAVSVSRDEGRSFSSPVIAIDVKGRGRGGAHRGPRIGVDAQNHLTVTAPLTFDDAEYKRRYPTADLFFAHSTDGGKTWTRPVQVNEVAKKAPEALHWMAVAPSGESHVAWLDMRSREKAGQDIFYARLADGKVGQNHKVASTVCECCAPGLAVDADANPFLAFREGGDRSSREIFARHSSDGGRTFTEIVQVNRTKTLEHG
jgi:hypothetical protein